MSDIDYTDDWMNPKASHVWAPRKPEDKMVYAILRAKKTIVFGDPGHIIEWEEWSKFDTAEERNAELDKLKEKHPLWRLKERDYNPYVESISRRAIG